MPACEGRHAVCVWSRPISLGYKVPPSDSSSFSPPPILSQSERVLCALPHSTCAVSPAQAGSELWWPPRGGNSRCGTDDVIEQSTHSRNSHRFHFFPMAFAWLKQLYPRLQARQRPGSTVKERRQSESKNPTKEAMILVPPGGAEVRVDRV